MSRIIEIRTYKLRPGSAKPFRRLFLEQAAPMLERWNVDVVAQGASLHDPDSQYLIRAYDDLDARERSQDAFYGSDEWRNGPREPILALIESYYDLVLELDEDVIDALRSGH